MKNVQEFLIENMKFNDLNPLVAGWQKCNNGYTYGPHIREYYLIHFVVSGKGVLLNSKGEHPVSKNKVFIIKPGEITTYKADEKDPWHYIWIGFSGKLAEKLDRLPSVMEYYDNSFFQIEKCEELSYQREMFLAAKLFEIVSVLTAKTPIPPRYEKLAADYIAVNFMKDVKIEEIAAQIGINQQYLSRLFKGRYGKSMRSFLLETRLSHAKALLKTGMTVRETSLLCGYEDIFHFSKMFKKKYGVSPKNYKKDV